VRVYVESYGCSQNQGEGSAIARDLAAQGHELLGSPDRADVGVLVTCGVIGATEARMVRRWRALSDRLPRTVVTGCLVPLRTGLLVGPGLDRTTFVPIREQHSLSALLAGWGRASPTPPSAPASPNDGAHAPVTEEVVIAQGCVSGCTYCYSRLARGPLESVSSLEIVRRVSSAVARGAVEVRLTSLDTSAWGLDLPTGERLPDLLEIVAAIPGEFRVRVGMMSPQSLAPILEPYLGALRDPRFFRFLHLPVQSGSDRVLEGMRRGYSAAEFGHQVERARDAFPELHLSTDVIVGFPGETERDFEATEAVLAAAAPETVNVTRFSPRPGTPAARRRPVESRVAKRRSRALAELRRTISRARLERWIGTRAPGRVVEYGPDGSAMARLDNYLPVVLDRRPPLGAFVDLQIEGARSTYLLGRLSEGPAF
jgi:threonylcarbamoyladenosine tRNA methylthiotransferase CDKAL1